MRTRFQHWLRTTFFRARATAAFWRNPVVVRDIRVRLRGPRAFLYIALYLGLLGAVVLAGYDDATSSGYGLPGETVLTAQAIQSQLQSLYYFVFMTLAGLVCFIAPALTASSVTTERQRLTLDLLITTPLSSSELLVGKMVSSMAFLGLLLILSLPASALCVILGGATMADVFRIYALLLMDGLLLSAVGLYFSATSRNSMNAIVSTYVTIGAILWFTAPFLAYAMIPGGPVVGAGNALFAVAALNPFLAVTIPAGSFDLFGLQIPMGLLSVAAAFIAIRLLVTGATYKMGSYGTDALGSLRRQVLFITALGAFLTAYGIAYGSGVGPAVVAGSAIRIDLAAMEYTMIVAAAFAGLFMPNLFTPETPEDAPPGAPVDGAYRPRYAFRPKHAGSLPYFQLWLGTMTVGMLVGVAVTGFFPMDVVGRILLTALYISGLGYLGWCVARRVSTLVAGLSGARAMAFGALIVITALPILLVIVAKQIDTAPDSVFAPFWVFYPVIKPAVDEAAPALLTSTALCYGAGTLICPFWRKIVPAGMRFWGAAARA